MGKGNLCASPRSASRHEKAEYTRALELFLSRGEFQGGQVLVAHVMTYCFDRGIPFEWREAMFLPGDVSKITRASS